MKKLSLIIVCVCFLGCKMLRTVDKENTERKEETSTKTTSTKTTEEQIQGGRIISDIIPESEREIDSLTGLYKEVIQKINDGGLTKTIHYRPDGTVTTDCEHEAFYRKIIEQMMQDKSESVEESTKTKNTESEKETKGININLIVAIIAAFVFLFLDRKF